MSSSVTPGIENPSASSVPIGGADRPIARLSGATTAFVGRALRGPINRAIPINSYAEYQQIFGGLWQPSSLSYAIEQFFDQGGRHAIVVRVVNGGAPPTIVLPCGKDQLTLQALAPGTREFLRAAVDYDNLCADGEEAPDTFNLVVQRVRAPDSERIEVQETFRRVSIDPGTQRYVVNALADSQLVRVRGAVPKTRPDATASSGARQQVGYSHSNNDGDDGLALTDYDIIGSAVQRTGIFALTGVDNIGFLYIPPLARQRDVGASTLLVAEKFCRDRRALLIVDPSVNWGTVDAAIAGVAALNFRSEHALLYFPRLTATDRLRARSEIFSNGGAVAGMLARAEEKRAVWAAEGDEPEPILRSGVRLSVPLSEADRWRLAMHGINGLRTTRNAANVQLPARTLAGGVNSAADCAYLAPQRLAALLLSSIECGTRWVAWSKSEAGVWARVARQVTDFLRELTALGAFPSAPADCAYMVVCDERVNSPADVAANRLNILLVVAAMRAGEYRGFLISHAPTGGSIKPVTVNRLEMPFVAEPHIVSAADTDPPLRQPRALAP